MKNLDQIKLRPLGEQKFWDIRMDVLVGRDGSVEICDYVVSKFIMDQFVEHEQRSVEEALDMIKQVVDAFRGWAYGLPGYFSGPDTSKTITVAFNFKPSGAVEFLPSIPATEPEGFLDPLALV